MKPGTVPSYSILRLAHCGFTIQHWDIQDQEGGDCNVSGRGFYCCLPPVEFKVGCGRKLHQAPEQISARLPNGYVAMCHCRILRSLKLIN